MPSPWWRRFSFCVEGGRFDFNELHNAYKASPPRKNFHNNGYFDEEISTFCSKVTKISEDFIQTISYSSSSPAYTNQESDVKIFTRHPNEVGETYIEHFKTASSFGVPMILGGLACLLHGIFPFLFEKSGSKLVTRLYERMVANRLKTHNFARSSHELDWCI